MESTTEFSVISKTSSVTIRSNKTNNLPLLPPLRNSSPTITPKLAKRAGLLSESKHKEDHISDSTGYVPITSYRPSRTHLSPREHYAANSIGHKNVYHTAVYDSENWKPDNWELDYTKKHLRFNSTRVQHIEAECQDDYMKIRIGFNGSFNGLVYSAGYAYDPDCMYINGTGSDYFEFYIQLNRCGTLGKNALNDEKRKNPTNFMWNTVSVQYNPLIEEEFDEHFKVTCEYGYDFWKTVTFPFLDVEVATGNPVVFTLSPPECFMEIQNGYGIGGSRVTGPVRVGDPLTLIIYMRSKYEGFDIVVNDCYAHNGANKRIQLIDEYGCPVNEKLISRFRGSWSDGGIYETQVYAYMKTFRFTGSPALYIECDVRMCHGRCPSQPCHWRNLKAISKRDVLKSTPKPETNASLSENINLFQSLRVLQEEEETHETTNPIRLYSNRNIPEICVTTSMFSTAAAAISLLICILSALVMATCLKIKNLSTQTQGYESYVTHKGQIS
ncbi:uncharacterized protein LOC129911249 [Episyrphus balteatus]|uniref:uncharacterized protein LOC129911249 n=1 Tax=Episyrphus balteatus TaxID=286459 RepID=UPI00248532AB|nr:uncharacterized protein LOC129911249 [Episyrphus balteatus]